MKILLVYYNMTVVKIPPLGLCYISAVLEKNGYEARILEAFPGISMDMRRYLKAYSPDIVAFNCVSPAVSKIIEMNQEIKRVSPETITIAGGPHPTALPEQMLQYGIDIVVVGEGEETMLELVRCIENGGKIDNVNGIAYKGEDGKSVHTAAREPLSNLDELPFPARHLLNMEWYIKRSALVKGYWLKSATIITSRGCPGRCIFCQSNNIFGGRVRYRSAVNIVDEIEELVERYGIEGLWITDDTFTLNKERVFSICDEMDKRKLKIKWSCEAIVSQASPELLKRMKASGCRLIEFGVESGSQKVLDMLKKNTKVSQIVEAFDNARAAGIGAQACIIIGSPGEEADDIKMTKKLLKRIRPTWAPIYFSTPYPGTALYDIAVKNGWTRPYSIKGRDSDWCYDLRSQRPVMQINFNAEQLLRLRRQLQDLILTDTFKAFMKNSPAFFLDMIMTVLKHPGLILDMARHFLKTRAVEECFRKILDQYGYEGIAQY